MEEVRNRLLASRRVRKAWDEEVYVVVNPTWTPGGAFVVVAAKVDLAAATAVATRMVVLTAIMLVRLKLLHPRPPVIRTLNRFHYSPPLCSVN